MNASSKFPRHATRHTGPAQPQAIPANVWFANNIEVWVLRNSRVTIRPGEFRTLCTGEIRSRIALGASGFTEARISQASYRDFSTCQKQLIRFAHGPVHYPRMMILDEATAAADTETELLAGRSAIVIAHRPERNLVSALK